VASDALEVSRGTRHTGGLLLCSRLCSPPCYNRSWCPAACLIVRRRRSRSPPSPPPSTTSSDYEDRAAAKAAALWSERSSGESNDGMSGTNCLRGSIADRLHNTKFDSESARSMVRMVSALALLLGCHVVRAQWSHSRIHHTQLWRRLPLMQLAALQGFQHGSPSIVSTQCYC